MYRLHGFKTPWRALAPSNVCLACNVKFGNRDRLIAHLMNRTKCADLLLEIYTPLPNHVVEKLDLAARARSKANARVSPAVRLHGPRIDINLRDSGPRSLSERDVEL